MGTSAIGWGGTNTWKGVQAGNIKGLSSGKGHRTETPGGAGQEGGKSWQNRASLGLQQLVGSPSLGAAEGCPGCRLVLKLGLHSWA